MADLVSKILVRQGTDVQRRTANSTGIIFSSGEPAFCTDTKRLFIGDGSTSGGISVGNRNLGSVNVLFGSYQNNFSFEAVNVFNSKGASPGDFIYDKTTRNIYSLSSVSNFPPLTSDLAKYDSIVLVNPDTFQLVNNILNVKQGGIKKEFIDFGVVDGVTLEKPGISDGLRIKNNGVQNQHLFNMPAYSVKGNSTGSLASPVDIVVGPNQFVGRTASSALTSIPLSAIITASGLAGANGVEVSSTNLVSLDTDYFTVDAPPTPKVTVNTPVRNLFTLTNEGLTTLNNGLTIQGTTNATGSVNVVGSGYYSNNLRINGTLFAPSISGTSGIVLQNSTSVTGNVTVNGTGGNNNITGDINNINGVTNIIGNTTVTGGLTITLDTSVQGSIYCTNDVVAFYTSSDQRVKDNIKPIGFALDKISYLKGCEFVYNDRAPQHLKSRPSYGLIAQDVEKVLPHAVDERANGFKGVNYENVIPLLVQCIKELKEEIALLKNK